MSEWLAKIVEFLKLPIRYFWVLLIVSGLGLFLPSDWLKTFGTQKLAEEYRPWLGTAFLVSFAVLAITSVETTVTHIRRKWHKRRLIVESKEAIRHLGPKEKAILREFFIQEQDAIQLPIDQAMVAGLITKGILVQIGQYGERSLAGLLFPLSIRKEIKRTLILDDIGLPEEPTEADIQRIRDERPEFLHEIEQHNEVFHTSWTRRRF